MVYTSSTYKDGDNWGMVYDIVLPTLIHYHQMTFFSKREEPWNPAGTASAVVSLQHRGHSCVWLGG
jgi:hypothetical protein